MWLWLRPLNQRSSAAVDTRRLALSPESACLSFAHLLDLLLDAPFLKLGDLSLQVSPRFCPQSSSVCSLGLRAH